MKKTILSLLLSTALLGSVCGCTFSGADDSDTTPPSISSGDDTEKATGYQVNFVCGEHVKVLIYESQNYTDGEEATVAYSRDGDTGELLNDGNGQVNFKIVCDEGYEVTTSNIVINGTYKNLKGSADTGVDGVYRITKIASALTVTLTATEKVTTSTEDGEVKDDEVKDGEESGGQQDAEELAKALGVTITYGSGTQNCYTVEGSTITFNTISAKTAYSISGTLNGNIVIDVGDSYKFELDLEGLTVTNSTVNPVTILSGDEVSLSAKNGTSNYINDNRADVSSDSEAYSAAIYSTCDLVLKGKGSLSVASANNNGIHTKDDLTIQNLTLSVTCVDNALKGNDSVEITSGAITLIATGGDCIKTSNSGLSSKNKQKGSVTISGGDVTLYAACDGIDAAYDVTVSDSANLTINTNEYSSYTGEIKKSSTADMYILTSSSNTSSYRYAIYFYNSDTDYVWKEATYYGTAQGNNGRSRYYVYKIDRPTNYTNFAVYRFSSSQSENSVETYNAASDGKTINTNTSYNAITISSSSSSTKLTYTWTTLNTSSSGSSDTYSSKGIKSDNQITISGGTVVIKSTDDCLHANYGETLENGSTGVGNIIISGGDITLTSGDDAVHADYQLTISGGTVEVVTSYEGLEANLIQIDGGDITVYATDDGVNAAGDYVNPCINVTGGNLDVTVGTGDVDGIDSNGDYVQTGGFVVTRDGTTQSGGMASGLDIDGTCTITGGTFICVGAIGETPSTSSQCWVKFGNSSSGNMNNNNRPGSMGSNTSSTTFTAGTYTVKDGSGNKLFEFTLSSSYSGLWISSSQFSTGNSYTLTNDTTTKTWTQSSNATSVS